MRCPRCKSNKYHKTNKVWSPKGIDAYECNKCGYIWWEINEGGIYKVPAIWVIRGEFK